MTGRERSRLSAEMGNQPASLFLWTERRLIFSRIAESDGGRNFPVRAGSSSGGRCAMLYRLNPLHAVYLLLTIERGRLRWKLKDLDGRVLAQASRQGEGRLWEAIGETAQSIKELYP